MSYYVRLLTASEKIVPISVMQQQVNSIKLSKGMDQSWEQIEVLDSRDNLLAVVERDVTSAGSPGENKLARLRDMVRDSYPVSAREWLRNYLSRVKMIYAFQLFPDNIQTKENWQILGRVQNLLKDELGGLIQADNEGFYNENGDYVLWQMYSGAAGTIPAAVLNESGEWVPFQLNLGDKQAVERFKQGEVPGKGFFKLLFGR